MAEVRVQVAFHFTFDPAKQLAALPEEITKTIAVGDKVTPEKVQSGKVIGDATRTAMLIEMEKLVLAAQKTAKPAKKEAPKTDVPEEAGAQGSLL